MQGPILVLVWSKFGPQSFFRGFYLYPILDIVASYHYMQFQEKLMNQTWENGKKPSFGFDFDPFGPNSGHQFFFSKIWLRQSLDIMVSYHHAQYLKNTNDSILRKLSYRRTETRTEG